MNHHEFGLESEILEEFRENLSRALRVVGQQLIDKKMPGGTVTATIGIALEEQTDQKTGEIYYDIEVTPNIKIKIGAKGTVDCDPKKGLLMRDKYRNLVIASNQISMDEILEAQKGA